jgi:phosphate transport system ATP-binding protein
MIMNDIKIETFDVNVWFGKSKVLENLNLKIPCGNVIAIMGPSGCGKTTLIREFNRMNDIFSYHKIVGKIHLDGNDITESKMDVVSLRKKVGMVFQQPNPFPKSIFDNVSYGPIIHGINKKEELEMIVEESLKEAALWDEVKDRLKESALNLSGGQQQRLCIARTLAIKPEVILMDEPCSAIDPAGTAKIEELMIKLKEDYTVIIVTHNMQQAARVSDYTAFLYLGKLIEYGRTKDLFEKPTNKLTEQYITGRFG